MSAEPRLAHSHSDTAEATAAMRASETLLPPARRLLEDPVARDLVRRPAYRLLTRSALGARLTTAVLERRVPGLYGHVILRSRYADDLITAAFGDGVRQVVMLGAGFDSTAFRLGLPARLYEVDVPTTQEAKRSRLARSRWQPRMETSYVACRFGTDDLAERLLSSGFDAGAPALFVWLGVVPYLNLQAFESTVSSVRRLSAPGSGLVMDYVDSSVLDGTTTHPGGRRIARMVAKRGEPLRTGFTPATLRSTLAAFDFIVTDDVGLVRLSQRYAAPAGPRYTRDGWNRVAHAKA